MAILSLEQQFRETLKYHGFENAATEIELTPKQRRSLPELIASWKHFPKCMNIFPITLSKKDKSYLKG